MKQTQKKKKDKYVDLETVQKIKTRYVNELRDVIKYADRELEEVHGEKIEALYNCKIILKDFKEQDIDNTLKNNLDEIYDEVKEKYLQKTVEEILYKEINKGLVKALSSINKTNVRTICRLTNRAGEEIIIQGIKELD